MLRIMFSPRELAVSIGYATFLLCILFLASIVYLTVDIGTLPLDGNGNVSRMLP